MSHKVRRAGDKQRAAEKVAPVAITVEASPAPARKPAWIRTRIHHAAQVQQIKRLLRAGHLHTVCEEASCPNLGECFSSGTATFMIMGAICTRRCPFCDVAHGRPLPLDAQEPHTLAEAVAAMQLRYVVLTSVNRDDLRDGGGAHFAACIAAIRARTQGVRIEALVPDFRGRVEPALNALCQHPPDVFNHNLETVPRLYHTVRPGADYQGSLTLLAQIQQRLPGVATKSGLMLGLGESDDEVLAVLQDLRAHGCERLTLGQYLQPSRHHLPVSRYVTPEAFSAWGEQAKALGFLQVASAPLVRSSYHAAIHDQHTPHDT